MFKARERDPIGLDQDQRQHLFNQIVDDSDAFEECAVLEGKPYQYLLRLCTHFDDEKLYGKNDPSYTYDDLKQDPERFRGHIIAVERSVVIEVQKPRPLDALHADLKGYSIVEGLLTNRLREVYAVYFLTTDGPGLYKKFQDGIDHEKNPVIRVTGFFMKNFAKKDSTNDIWREPLLIAPYPKFSRGVQQTYNVRKELEQGKVAKLLPSRPVEYAGAEERFVVELLPPEHPDDSASARLRIDGQVVALTEGPFVDKKAREFVTRLPSEHAQHPSAVLIRAKGAPDAPVSGLLQVLKSNGFSRLFFKDKNETSPSNPAH